MHTFRWLSLVLALAVSPAAANAESPSREQLLDILQVKLRTVQHMALNPVLIGAVRRQNQERLPMTLVRERDEAWKASADLIDIKRRLMAGPAAGLLRSTVGDGSTFTEAFLTDNQGANVAVFPPTSDYWQGDEEKWSASYRDGDGRVFVGPLEFDNSTGKYAVQISAPVIDGTATIGVLVVGVSVDYVTGRRGQE